MTIKTRLHWLIIILLFFCLTLVGCDAKEQISALSESDTTTASGDVHIGSPTEINLDKSLGCLFHPITAGDVLVARSRLSESVQMAIVNLKTGEAYRLDAEGVQAAFAPVDYVAMVQDKEDSRDLPIYDLSDGEILRIGKGQLRRPFVSNDIVVWEEFQSEGLGLSGYNLSEKQQIAIAQGEGLRIFPQVSGDWVIYLFSSAQDVSTYTLCAHQISSGEDFEIGILPLNSGDYAPSRFSVDGNRVVWRGIRWNEIHIYDLDTRTDEIVFTDEKTNAVLNNLDIAGDLVIWSGGSYDRIGYDLVNQRLFDILELSDEINIHSETILITKSYIVWLITEVDPDTLLWQTPWPRGTLRPTPTAPIDETEQCRVRLFVAAITRQ